MNIRRVVIVLLVALACLIFFFPANASSDVCAKYAQQILEPRHNLYTTNQEVAFGKQLLKKDYPNTKRYGRIHKKEIALLRAIETTLWPHLPEYAQRFKLSYRILHDEKRLDAHSLPGGIILFSSGTFMTGTLDQIAVVLAHEIGHVGLRHGTHRSTVVVEGQKRLFAALLTQGDLLERDITSDQLESLVGPPINLTDLAIEQERESDIFSARVASLAGYDVQAMALMHEDTYDAAKEEYMRSYMDHPSRIERAHLLRCFSGSPVVARPELETELSKIKTLYRKKGIK